MVQAQMFHISDLDQFLAKTLSTTSRLANSRAAGIAIEFSQQLVRACLVDSSLLAPGDLSATLDVLDAIGSSNLGMQRLNNIVLQARQPRRYVACRSCPVAPSCLPCGRQAAHRLCLLCHLMVCLLFFFSLLIPSMYWTQSDPASWA